MAKILLSVGIDPAAKKNFEKQVKDVEGVFKGLTEALNSVSPNKELTKQLNALAKAYNALTNSRKLDLKEEKIAIAQKKVAAAQDKASAALINAETRAKKENRLETEAERKELEKNTKTQEKNAEARSKLIERIGNQAKSILTSAFIRQPLMNLLNLLQGIDDVLVKVENRVIELRRVLNEDIAGGELSGKIYEIAQKYGQTFENVGEIVTNFARTGMTWADSVKATEAAVLALNVAELDATQASEGMIAIMTQFGISASELELVVDKLNKTSDNFPVTTEKLLVGLQRTGSAAANANLSLDQTIGLLTTLSKATGRSGANLGTAVNALIQYSTKSSALETFSKLSSDVSKTVQQFKQGGATILDVWQSVSEVIKNADARQAKILDGMRDQEDVKNLAMELQDELADIYEREQDVYGTANTFRKNYFIALLKNIETVQESIDTISNAAGYSQKENAQYINTYVAKVNQLKDAWEALANDEQGILGFKKLLVEIGTLLVEGLQWIGGLRTAAIALGTVLASVYTKKIAQAISSWWSGLFKVTVATEGATAATETLKISMQGWIAIIGAAITVISLLVGLVQQYNEEQHIARIEAIDRWKAEKDAAISLKSLYNEYQSLTKGTDEYYAVEEKIVQLLGEKGDKLKLLTKQTDIYSESVKTLTNIELIRLGLNAKEAKKSAKKELEDFRTGVTGVYKSGSDFATKPSIDLFKEYGINAYQTSTNVMGTTVGGVIEVDPGKTAEERVEYYNNLLKLREGIIKKFNETGKDQYWNMLDWVYGEIDAFENLVKDYTDATDALNAFDKARAELSGKGGTSPEQQIAKDLADVQDKYEDIIATLKEYQSEQEESIKKAEREKSLTEAQLALEEARAKARKEYISGALDQYLNGLKEEATLAEKQNAIIEKRKALEEALQALEDAKNQRNVRVLNPDGTLGGWQANEKDVKNAQDRVEQATKSVNTAVESLNDYLKNTAIAEIKQKIEDGSASESEIRDILAKWLGLGEGDTAALNDWADGVANTFVTAFNAVKSDNSPILLGISGVQSAIEKLAKAEDAQKQYFEQKMFDEVYAALSSGDNVSNAQLLKIIGQYSKTLSGRESLAKIADIIKDKASIDIFATGSISSGNTGTITGPGKRPITINDNGGVLSGIGGIKATREDEIVIDPALTRQILNPQYNKRYEDFVAANRLLFGDSRHIPAANMVRTVNNTSSNDQRSYTINGVPIPQRVAKEYTIEQVFNNMSLFKQ